MAAPRSHLGLSEWCCVCFLSHPLGDIGQSGLQAAPSHLDLGLIKAPQCFWGPFGLPSLACLQSLVSLSRSLRNASHRGSGGGDSKPPRMDVEEFLPGLSAPEVGVRLPGFPCGPPGYGMASGEGWAADR